MRGDGLPAVTEATSDTAPWIQVGKLESQVKTAFYGQPKSFSILLLLGTHVNIEFASKSQFIS